MGLSECGTAVSGRVRNEGGSIYSVRVERRIGSGNDRKYTFFARAECTPALVAGTHVSICADRAALSAHRRSCATALESLAGATAAGRHSSIHLSWRRQI